MVPSRGIPVCRPAEWAKHARTILAWPSPKAAPYKEDHAALCRATNDVSSVAEAVARFEPVSLLVDRECLPRAEKRFRSAHGHGIHVHSLAGGGLDVWMRDMAPTFTIERNSTGRKRELRGVTFNFNGWGNKSSSEAYSSFAKHYLAETGIRPLSSSITTEGGALEIDGEGTLMASESSLVNDNRNPGQTKSRIEAELSRTLGVTKFIWIPGLRNGDSTDFHIDAYARFVCPGVVVVSTPSDTEEASLWVSAYAEAREVLASATDAKGRKLEIMEMQEPRAEKVVPKEYLAVTKHEFGHRPVHSYVNFLIVNGGVILPQFGDEMTDKRAVETARKVFGKEREVVPVLIRELPLLGGGIHCSSQEVPCVEGAGSV
ncbi:hypothetical protein J3458_009234 [Metarhizium acridum]|uniref:Peptidylarginine deiminase-like enzyme n=1 Tax=Metarhizium acridum (strain CQMa 102) TaxID=655827 RepID=E9DTA1_METAQ|nr:peptidylarginine deiminase-like enzyme [Metarhizium acridum CQMa 102]EFY93200.1 peptidylarginine deiminase-like enzyme [Metarhizium acridum CQMa 102]KAG8415384.1 hypothetical protein J3458_009234 [Metarhizium acridum]